MNDSLRKLLDPVSEAAPAGPDLAYDPRFDALETKLLGKPEVEIGNVKRPAEPPDWEELVEASRELLSETKHLRVAVILSCGLLRTKGLPGFCDALQIIQGFLEKYWTSLYPLLDPEDNNDPTQRLNLLSALTAKRGTVTGWLTITDYLFTAPLCQPKGAAPVTLEAAQAAKLKGNAPTEGNHASAVAQLEAAIRGATPEQIATHHQALQDSLDAVHSIDQFLTQTLGAGNTISFEVLHLTLTEMAGVLAPFVGLPATGAGASSAATTPGTAAAGQSGVVVSGPIASRQDVSRALESICEYYRQAEPASPVPYLLRRAQKLAMMNFVQAVQELNLGSIDALRPSMGSALDSEAPPPSPPA